MPAKKLDSVKSLEADGDTLIVGSVLHFEENNNGSAYIFERN